MTFVLAAIRIEPGLSTTYIERHQQMSAGVSYIHRDLVASQEFQVLVFAGHGFGAVVMMIIVVSRHDDGVVLLLLVWRCCVIVTKGHKAEAFKTGSGTQHPNND